MQNSSNVAHKLRRGPLVRFMIAGQAFEAMNDNGGEPVSKAMFEASLRHFAAHGLGAARAARLQAEYAFFAGDRAAYQWWIGVCRLLDRRMAAMAARDLQAATPDRSA